MEQVIPQYYRREFARHWAVIVTQEWQKAKAQLWAEGMDWASGSLALDWLQARRDRAIYAKQGDTAMVESLTAQMARIWADDQWGRIEQAMEEHDMQLREEEKPDPEKIDDRTEWQYCPLCGKETQYHMCNDCFLEGN